MYWMDDKYTYLSKYNFQRDTILDIFIVCSRSSHRGQGIAGQLGLFRYSQSFDNDLYFIRLSSGGGWLCSKRGRRPGLQHGAEQLLPADIPQDGLRGERQHRVQGLHPGDGHTVHSRPYILYHSFLFIRMGNLCLILARWANTLLVYSLRLTLRVKIKWTIKNQLDLQSAGSSPTWVTQIMCPWCYNDPI